MCSLKSSAARFCLNMFLCVGFRKRGQSRGRSVKLLTGITLLMVEKFAKKFQRTHLRVSVWHALTLLVVRIKRWSAVFLFPITTAMEGSPYRTSLWGWKFTFCFCTFLFSILGGKKNNKTRCWSGLNGWSDCSGRVAACWHFYFSVRTPCCETTHLVWGK